MNCKSMPWRICGGYVADMADIDVMLNIAQMQYSNFRLEKSGRRSIEGTAPDPRNPDV